MPSSYTSSLRLEQQFTGENVNVWGVRLNTVIGRTDTSIAGWKEIALTENRSLQTSNTDEDEARSAALRITGVGGFVLTLPAVSKGYFIKNEAAAAITLTTGSGATVILDAGDIVQVFCDGASVYQLGYNAQGLKDYVAGVAFSYNAGNLPAMPGNAGKFIRTDGSTASWQIIQSTDIGDWNDRKAEAETYARAQAIAFAVALGS